MKQMHITDDKSATKAPVVRLRCECGWEEKAFATREARSRAEHHMRRQHTHGRITYNGHTLEV